VLKSRTSLGLLSFMRTTTDFGTPVDVTLAELAIGKDLQYIRVNGTLVGGLIG
jgi:hypothetical protein